MESISEKMGGTHWQEDNYLISDFIQPDVIDYRRCKYGRLHQHSLTYNVSTFLYLFKYPEPIAFCSEIW